MACSCPIGKSTVLDQVDKDIKDGVSLRKVAQKYGFALSTTGRHAKGCLDRAVLDAHRQSKAQFDSRSQRLWKKLPWQEESILISDIRKAHWWLKEKTPQKIEDVRLLIVFEPDKDGNTFTKSPAQVERELAEASNPTSDKKDPATAPESQSEPL